MCIQLVLYNKYNLSLYVSSVLFNRANLYNICNMYSKHLLDFVKTYDNSLENYQCKNEAIAYRSLLVNQNYHTHYYRLNIEGKLYYYQLLCDLQKYNVKNHNYNMIIDVYDQNNSLLGFIKQKHLLYRE